MSNTEQNKEWSKTLTPVQVVAVLADAIGVFPCSAAMTGTSFESMGKIEHDEELDMVVIRFPNGDEIILTNFTRVVLMKDRVMIDNVGYTLVYEQSYVNMKAWVF